VGLCFPRETELERLQSESHIREFPVRRFVSFNLVFDGH
jgi:hypothetical protein